MRTYYDNLVRIWSTVSCKTVDPGVIRGCESGSYVPLESVVAQFKYLRYNCFDSKDYQIVKRYLVKLYGKQAVKDLEAM